MKFAVKQSGQDYHTLRFDNFPMYYIGVRERHLEMQSDETADSQWSMIVYGKRRLGGRRDIKYQKLEKFDLGWDAMKGHELLVGLYHSKSGDFLGVQDGNVTMVCLSESKASELAAMCLWVFECVDHNQTSSEVAMTVGFSSIPLVVAGGVVGGAAVASSVLVSAGAVTVADAAISTGVSVSVVGTYAGMTVGVGGAVATVMDKVEGNGVSGYDMGASAMANAASLFLLTSQ